MSSAKMERERVIDRVMYTWSLIKMIPQSHLSEARLSVTALLEDNADLSERELLILGLKHLHGTSPPKRSADTPEDILSFVACSLPNS
jgi:hypothetical protein